MKSRTEKIDTNWEKKKDLSHKHHVINDKHVIHSLNSVAINYKWDKTQVGKRESPWL